MITPMEKLWFVILMGMVLIPVTTEAASKTYFIHNDHLGTPQVITDEDQNVVWQADYDPFGKATITTGMITSNLRFPGQYYDEETGLHYNYFRYYDPQLGRYITSDHIGLQGGINTYLYANANSLRFIDPTGRITELELVLGGIYAISHEAGVIVFIGTAGAALNFGGGYVAGMGINYAIEKYSGDSIGGHIYDWKHESTTNDTNSAPPDNSGIGDEGFILPDYGSLEPVDDVTKKLFCEQNPGAPNCQGIEPNGCN